MGRRRNVQQQVEDRRGRILDTARAFIEHPERYEWLRTMLARYGLDRDDGILVELRSVPDQGCWVHYGTWLTSSGNFLRFTADEAYGPRPLDESGRLEDCTVEDVTDRTSTVAQVPGIGRSSGWLALEVLRELGKGRVKPA